MHLTTLLVFVLETVQHIRALKTQEDPSFCVLGNLQLKYSFHQGGASAATPG